MTTPHHTHAPAAWRGVFFDGPQSDRNHDGDEIPVWFVFIGDEDAEPVSHLTQFHSFELAEGHAHHLAQKHGLELIHEAMPD